MKIRDIVSVVKNSKNGQTNFNLKKRTLEKIKVSQEDLLDIDLKFILRNKHADK